MAKDTSNNGNRALTIESLKILNGETELGIDFTGNSKPLVPNPVIFMAQNQEKLSETKKNEERPGIGSRIKNTTGRGPHPENRFRRGGVNDDASAQRQPTSAGAFARKPLRH